MTKENSTVSISETLTEQWKNRTLYGGWYFIKFENGSILPVYYCGFNREFEFRWDWKISKVLAPASYDHFVELTEKANQFSQMVKKVKKLEKQLKEANNLLLGFLDENICSFDHNGYCQEHSSTEPNYRCIQQELKWYFKKYEVLK